MYFHMFFHDPRECRNRLLITREKGEQQRTTHETGERWWWILLRVNLRVITLKHLRVMPQQLELEKIHDKDKGKVWGYF